MFAPAILSLVAIDLAVRESWWFLAAVPFVWLGSVCAQPNLNLADGCLAYVAMTVGAALTPVSGPLGIAMLTGTFCGLLASAIEKRIRMRPSAPSPGQ